MNSEETKILVTGATGFIGEKLVKRLAMKGYGVRALYRSKDRINQSNHPNIQYMKGDLLDIKSLEPAVEGCHAIIHLAAYAKVWAKDPGIYYRINVEGTENVVKLAKKYRVDKLILTSSAGVFGPSDSGIVNETSQRKIPYFSDYEETKALAVQKVLNEADNKMKVVVVYPTRVYGPGLLSESNGMTRLIRMNLRNCLSLIPGNGKSVGNYVFIDDVVEGHLLALTCGKSGEGYILGGENMSFSDFFKEQMRLTSKKTVIIHIPRLILIIIAMFFEARTQITGSAPLITRKWTRRYLYNWEVSSKKAMMELSYKITPFEECLNKTLKWLEKAEL